MNCWPQHSIVIQDEDGDPTAAGSRATPAIPALAITLMLHTLLRDTYQPSIWPALPAAVETAFFQDRQ